MSLQGGSTLANNSVRSKFHGAVEAGEFQILGNLTKVATDNLIYGVALNQDDSGLHIDDLFFAVQGQSGNTQCRNHRGRTNCPAPTIGAPQRHPQRWHGDPTSRYR